MIGVEPHKAVVTIILSETLDTKLELGQAMVLGRELGARQEPEVRGLGLLARDTIACRP